MKLNLKLSFNKFDIPFNIKFLKMLSLLLSIKYDIIGYA